jgi:hypothetical protein
VAFELLGGNMLEWKPRLLSLVLVLIAIASFAGWGLFLSISTSLGNYGW